jgi:trimethylamine-N-oxide reductase (cytochrome c)
VWLHPSDAEKRGIKDGDVVEVFNERGIVLGGAKVWERIIPGAIYMDHGSRADFIVPGKIDRGGAINLITPHNTTSKNCAGMVCSGFLADVRKCDIEGMRKQYPEVFNRPYNKDSGLVFERVIVKK